MSGTPVHRHRSGGIVPRAKRTDRAEARRRSRAAAARPFEEDLAEDDGLTEATQARPARERTRPTTTDRPQRPSITNAFREAFHPLTLREDLAVFPSLLRTKAVWLPIVLTVIAGLGLYLFGAENVVLALIFQYFILPPAIGPVFLAGFLAPRASYLIGLVVGIAAAAVFSFLVLTTVNAIPDVPDATQTAIADQIIYAFLSSAMLGMFFAAAAAWYRRFLKLSSPTRNRRPETKRGSDGRTRAGTKPSPRR
jgi:hypothetical protein